MAPNCNRVSNLKWKKCRAHRCRWQPQDTLMSNLCTLHYHYNLNTERAPHCKELRWRSGYQSSLASGGKSCHSDTCWSSDHSWCKHWKMNRSGNGSCKSGTSRRWCPRRSHSDTDRSRGMSRAGNTGTQQGKPASWSSSTWNSSRWMILGWTHLS